MNPSQGIVELDDHPTGGGRAKGKMEPQNGER